MTDLKVPKCEEVWVIYANRKGKALFALTAKKNDRSNYLLYEVAEDGTMKKLGKSADPKTLEEKFNVRRRISA